MNIDKLSLAELKALNERVSAMIPKVRARELEAARKELHDLAAAKGYSLKELTATARQPRMAMKPAAKLRDAKSGVIWSGRGRMPKNFDRTRAEAMA